MHQIAQAIAKFGAAVRRGLRFRHGIVSVFLIMAFAPLCAECVGDISLRVDELHRYIEVGPISSHQWRHAEADTPAEAPQLMTVHVGNLAAFKSKPILGSYTRIGDRLRFEPRFAFRPGVDYVVRVTMAPVAASQTEEDRVRLLAFSGPPVSTAPQHQVQNVFPTSERLPANLLKFYIHFSGPMSRGEVYRRVRLVDESGEVDMPFLELGEELWDPDGHRLTLLFDPGRIKRGLKPREDAGQILTSGKCYVLEIDGGWPDARGVPLVDDHQKKFIVTPADYTQPDASKWELKVPQSRTRSPLVVTFSEPLDHALLNRVISVIGPDERPIPGTVTVARRETQWKLRPNLPWREGDYRLTFDAALEDVAGNSIGRAFEVSDSTRHEPVLRERPFTILEDSRSLQR